MEIRLLGSADYEMLVAASRLFDGIIRPDAASRFFAEPGHYLMLAIVDGTPVGFVIGIEVTHPDRGTEMLLYELAVDPAFQRRGIGLSLTEALAALARAQGCCGMSALTEEDNKAALATYRRAGASDPERCVILNWVFDHDDAPTS
jgi:ribosomal protein S18 acetylase RimI-like enzyme